MRRERNSRDKFMQRAVEIEKRLAEQEQYSRKEMCRVGWSTIRHSQGSRHTGCIQHYWNRIEGTRLSCDPQAAE